MMLKIESLKKKRIWLKARVPEDEEAEIIKGILKHWAMMRQTPTHFKRAVRLYHTLLCGDYTAFTALLTEFFPGVALGMQMSRVDNSRFLPQPPITKIKIEETRSNVEDFFKDDEFGFGEVDFS